MDFDWKIKGGHAQAITTQPENYIDDREARGKTILEATSLYLPIVNLKAGNGYYFKIFNNNNKIQNDSRYLAAEFYDENKVKIKWGSLGFPVGFTEEVATKVKYAKIYYNGNDTDKVIGNTVIKKIGLKITSSASADDIDMFVPDSPSPDYPSEIETVNGSVEIKVDNGLETTDTNYQSYTKTLPIQQEMLEGDYIEDVEHHGWGKYEITGNEDWKKSGNPNNISYYLIINSILVNIDGNTFSPSFSESETKVAIVLSNHFKAISPNQLFEGSENGICLNWVGGEKQMRLGFGLDSDINTVDKLKAWLKSLYDAGTPVIVYYKLATPKSLELTEDQKSVLNSFYTYKNITNISLSDELASIDVTYKKDLETMFNNIIKQIPSSTSDTAET